MTDKTELEYQNHLDKVLRHKEVQHKKELDKIFRRDINEPPPTALNSQVGGDHYKNQGLQPFEITYANFGYQGVRASVYTKVNKYLTREKGEHRENIEKAIHCLQVQLEFLGRE
jgi:hypothetical protein